MAAFTRMSRLVNSIAIRRLFHSHVQIRHTLPISNIHTIISVQLQRPLPVFLSRHCSTTSLADEFSNAQANEENEGHEEKLLEPEYARKSPNLLDDKMRRLDYLLSKRQQMFTTDMYNCLELAEQKGSISMMHAASLIRSCGEILYHLDAQKRRDVFNDVSERLQKLVEDPDIMYQNRLLKTRLENKDFFDPAQVLADIESQPHLQINRITYQLLIAAYCLQGDIDGAHKILEHMRTLEIPIHESVYHSLTTGYMKQGDVDSARSMATVMSEEGCYLGSEWYTCMMLEYAEKGNLLEIQKVRADAELNHVQVDQEDLFHVLIILAQNGHDEAFNELLHDIKAKFSMMKNYNSSCRAAVHKLLAQGKNEEAVRIMGSLDVSVQSKEFKFRICNDLIRSLIMSDQPCKVIKDVEHKLFKIGLLPHVDFNDSMGMALFWNKMDLAEELLVDMLQSRFIRKSIVDDIIAIRQKAGDVDGLVDFIKHRINSSYNEASHVILATWRALKALDIEDEKLYSVLKEKGLSDTNVAMYRCVINVVNAQLDDALEYIDDLSSVCVVPLTSSMLLQAATVPGCDWEKLVKVVGKLGAYMGSIWLQKGMTSNLLEGMLKMCSQRADMASNAEEVVRYFINNGVIIHRSRLDFIERLLREAGVGGDVSVKLLEELESLSKTASTSFSNKERVVEMLQQYREDPDSLNQFSRDTAKLYLLRKCWRNGDTEKADKIMNEMEKHGFHFSGYDNYLLCKHHALKGDVGRAKHYKQMCFEELHRHPAPANLVIAAAYIRINEFESAIVALERSGEISSHDDIETNMQAVNLLKEISHNSDISYEMLVKLVDQLVSGGYIADRKNLVKICLMRAAINSGDSSQIMELAMEQSSSGYAIPMAHEILKLFVQKEDVDRLQSVVDMMSVQSINPVGDTNIRTGGLKVSSESATLHHLAIAFIRCGKLHQAQKIMENQSFDVGPDSVGYISEYYANPWKVQRELLEPLMEQYLKMMLRVRSNFKEDILFQLIRLYARTDVKKCTDVLLMYEEEEIVPRARTHRYLSKVLRDRNMPVPFEEPPPNDIPYRKNNSSNTMKLSSYEQDLITKITSSSIHYLAQDLLKDITSDDGVMDITSLRNIMRSLSKDSFHRQRFCVDLLDALDWKDIAEQNLQQLCTTRLLKMAYFRAQMIHQLQNGKEETFLTALRDEGKGNFLLSPPSLSYLQENRLDIFDQVSSILHARLEDGHHHELIVNMITVHILKGEMEEAKQLEQKYSGVMNLELPLQEFLSISSSQEKKYPKEEVLEFILKLNISRAHTYNYIRKWLIEKVQRNDMTYVPKFLESLDKVGFRMNEIATSDTEELLRKLAENDIQLSPDLIEKISTKRQRFRKD